MSKRWAAFRGTPRAHLLNTGDHGEESGGQMARRAGPLCPELRDKPSLNGECSLVPDPRVGLKGLQEQDHQPQDEVMFL